MPDSRKVWAFAHECAPFKKLAIDLLQRNKPHYPKLKMNAEGEEESVPVPSALAISADPIESHAESSVPVDIRAVIPLAGLQLSGLPVGEGDHE